MGLNVAGRLGIAASVVTPNHVWVRSRFSKRNCNVRVRLGLGRHLCAESRSPSCRSKALCATWLQTHSRHRVSEPFAQAEANFLCNPGHGQCFIGGLSRTVVCLENTYEALRERSDSGTRRQTRVVVGVLGKPSTPHICGPVIGNGCVIRCPVGANLPEDRGGKRQDCVETGTRVVR
jgi:hypothetical protein